MRKRGQRILPHESGLELCEVVMDLQANLMDTQRRLGELNARILLQAKRLKAEAS